MDDAVGWNVPGHHGIPLNHGAVPDTSELVDAGTSSKESVVPQSDMAGDHGIVGENIIISDHDVMREMSDGHEVIFVSDDGVPAALGAAVDRDIFPECVSVSNKDA